MLVLKAHTNAVNGAVRKVGKGGGDARHNGLLPSFIARHLAFASGGQVGRHRVEGLTEGPAFRGLPRPQFDDASGVVQGTIEAVPSTVGGEQVTAHLSSEPATGPLGQGSLHERVAGSCHDRRSASGKDGAFNVHGTLHVVDDGAFVLGGVVVKVRQDVSDKKRHKAVGVDEGARFGHSTNAVTVTVAAQSKLATVRGDDIRQIGHVVGSSRVRTVVRFAGVPGAMHRFDLGTDGLQHLDKEGPGNRVARVHGHVHRTAKRPHTFRDGRKVGRHVRGKGSLPFTGIEVPLEEDLSKRLDFIAGQRQVAPAHLESVVGWHGEVAGRDHHATVHLHRPACMVQRASGADVEVNDVRPRVLHALHQGVSQGRAGRPNVPAHGQALGTEVRGKRLSESLGKGGRQFTRAVTVGQSPDVVGLEAVLGPWWHAGPSAGLLLNAPPFMRNRRPHGRRFPPMRLPAMRRLGTPLAWVGPERHPAKRRTPRSWPRNPRCPSTELAPKRGRACWIRRLRAAHRFWPRPRPLGLAGHRLRERSVQTATGRCLSERRVCKGRTRHLRRWRWLASWSW